nr:PREDICTED: 39S ribosomal protein L53, mitochondrial [Opisthocomus hoazin]
MQKGRTLNFCKILWYAFYMSAFKDYPFGFLGVIVSKFLGYINHKRIQATNRNCEVTADVRHDGSEPLVDVMFADGERLIMKGANLTTIEMLTALGSRCNAKEIKEEQKSKKKSP